MNLNTFGGAIRPGRYDAIIAHGYCRMEDGVRFTTLVVRGTVEASADITGSIVMQSGELLCQGDLDAETIHGNGDIEVKGSLRCGSMSMTGRLAVQGPLDVGSDLTLLGAFSGNTAIVAGKATFLGHCDIGSIDATEVVSKPIRTAMFERFGMKEYLEPSRIGLVDADLAKLHWTVCHKAITDQLELTGHCRVGELVCFDSFRHDVTSSAAAIHFIDDEADGPQRKVA